MIDRLGPYLLGPNDTPENGIYTGDARELLPHLPSNSIDAIVTDPPFFLPATHYQSRKAWQRKWSDVSILYHWWDMMCKLFRQALKPTGYCLSFCGADSYAAFYPAMYNHWERLSCLVWDKLNPGLGRNWRHQHELILVACQRAAFLPQDGKLRTDVLRFRATPSKERVHPVQKPAALLCGLIQAASPIGGIICDPFCGSGTTAEAAIITGRRYICFDADSGYAQVARNHVRNLQPLFVLEPEQGEMTLETS